MGVTAMHGVLSYQSADRVTGYASVFTQTVDLLMSFGLDVDSTWM